MDKHDLDIRQIVLFFLAGIVFIPVVLGVLSWTFFDGSGLWAAIALVVSMAILALLRGKSQQGKREAFYFLFGLLLGGAVLTYWALLLLPSSMF